MTAEEFERLQAAIRDPDYVARLLADEKAQGLVEVDNPMRREVRPRRGTETAAHDPSCISLTDSEFNDHCDCRTLAMIDRETNGPTP
jgi:hypothetical protein